ncbi:helix-turn-helix transcriptional regulator [Cryptosporangium minutisporangium]|uniref:PAS domain-containing protein n=1 Tax=Cryptosporangium minutisporangium TaxID=113569 RepID=A0ABP6T0K7_9ACTN
MTPSWLAPYAPVCAAIAALLDPHGEVAVHDLATERIAALWNPLSGRAIGDDSLLDELPVAPGDAPVIGPYEKVLPDGRRCTSVSAVLRDTAGEPRALLCVNLDRSDLDRIAALSGALFAATQPRPPALFDRDWREQIALRVHEFRRTHPEPLDRDARRDLIAQLDREGLFAVRRSADLAAEALGVSRATVYALLKEVRA